jgi:transcriptional regulator with XRE-family HTH domain
MAQNIAHSDITGKTECRDNRLTPSSYNIYNGDMKLRLKEIRASKDMTQREVAERANMSLSYYTEIELGRKQINARRLESIAKALKVSPLDIIDAEQNPQHAELLALIERLDPDQRQIVFDLAQNLAKASGKSE